ncbi:MAG: GDSL-type esterase/lipase family protein [Roseburia sp.]|nr:GDSL-type esterase/lipase family protein [Roseburia sp.]
MNKSGKGPYVLPFLIVLSTFLFSILGSYWNTSHYHHDTAFASENLPLVTAMQGVHDKLYLPPTTPSQAIVPTASFVAADLAVISNSMENSLELEMANVAGAAVPMSQSEMQGRSVPAEPLTYDFTTAGENYFDNACFIGDSRTVGIRDYCDMENATFLCKTSLTIFDYDKPKITFNGKKTSVKDVLSQNRFAKIYLMVGINECGTGTPESFCEDYRAVVENIRELQPDALIFIQGNLLVTKEKSQSNSGGITNENISARNQLIATLANQRDIFYIDINESEFCEDGALVSSYTWDQVHVKAQYYAIWKSFLLEHAIVLNPEEAAPLADSAAPLADSATPPADSPQEEATPFTEPDSVPQEEGAEETP